MRKKLLIILLLFSGIKAYSQTDTLFWFAAPDISAVSGYDRPIQLRLTAYQQNCNVQVSIPSNVAFPPQIINIPANSTQTIDLTPWINLIECGPGDVVQNRGIRIKSDNKVSAYYEINGGAPNQDFFVLKGGNALGTEFFISSQYAASNSSAYSPLPLSSFNIVATEDNTVVNITPRMAVTGHAAGVMYNINLNKGQTYAAIATAQSAANHLQGSYVTSSKPIAITLADDLLGSACQDLSGDQTIPVNVLGTEYIIIKGDLTSPSERVYITATQDGTTISQNGSFYSTINKGQTAEIPLINSADYFQTTSPAYAFQLTGSGCELSSALIPKLSCTGSSSVSFVKTVPDAVKILLLVKNGGQGSFLVNGVAGIVTAGSFSVVAGTGGQWYSAKVTLSAAAYPNNSVIKVSNTISLFQVGYLQSTSFGASYGYFSDFNSFRAEANPANPTVCTGAIVNLYAETVASGTYSWDGTGGYNSASQNPILTGVTPAQSGNYILSVTLPGCGVYKDTVVLTVNPNVTNTVNQTICQGQSYLGYTTAGAFTDHFTSAAGCDSARTLNLTVKPKSFSTINAAICQGDVYAGHSTAGTFVDTYTAANGCDSVRTLNLTVKPKSFTTNNQSICQGQIYEGHTTSGTYVSTLLAANGCDSIYTLNLTVKPKSFTTNNQSICDGQSYEGHTTTGTYVSTLLAANGCDSLYTLNLTVKPKSLSNLTASICQGQIYAGHTSTGTYTDTYTAANGCDSVRTLSLTVKPKSFSAISKQICFGKTYNGHSTSGTYTDTYTAANGCDSIVTLNLIVDPQILTSLNKIICEGTLFEGYGTTGFYTDVFMSASGCDSTRQLNLTVNKLPVPDLGKDTAVCFDHNIILSPGTYNSYLWQDGSNNPTYTVSMPGTYSVTVTNDCGVKKDEIVISDRSCQEYFPNVFTPNGDSKNEFFKILNPGGITDYHLSVFNRWGEKIFETINLTSGWNGKYKGSAAVAGTYVWIAEFNKNGKPSRIAGNVLLLR